MRHIIVFLAGMAFSSAIVAQEVSPTIDEVRVGIASHDVYGGFVPLNAAGWTLAPPEDVAFDLLFRSPQIDAFTWLGAPRPRVGASVSLTGRETVVHAGLTWQVPLFETPLYLEATLGAAIHNGALEGALKPARNLGCRINFYEAFGIGATLGDAWTMTLSYEHTSNADLCAKNEGLSNLSLKLGRRF